MAMTAIEAKAFERTSAHSAATVSTLLECQCQPYIDVYTYKRWLAQGFQVQRGQKAIKLPLVKIKEVQDSDDDDAKRTVRILSMSAVFCRHQVAPVQATGVTPSTAPVPLTPPTPEPKEKPTVQPQPSSNVDKVMVGWEAV